VIKFLSSPPALSVPAVTERELIFCFIELCRLNVYLFAIFLSSPPALSTPVVVERELIFCFENKCRLKWKLRIYFFGFSLAHSNSPLSGHPPYGGHTCIS
jgi:hypothetical protein